MNISRYSIWLLLSLTLLLSACGSAVEDAELQTAAVPAIDLNSSYLLPADGRNTGLTCQGISGKTAIRNVRLSGGIRSDQQLNLDYLSTRTTVHVEIPFSTSKDAYLYGGIGGYGVGLTKDSSGQNVAVVPYGHVLRFDSPLQNLSNDRVVAQTTMRTELINPGAKPAGNFTYLSAFTSDFNRLFPPVFGPIGLGDDKEFLVLNFVVVLEESKGYAAGRGYLLSSVLLNPPGSTYIFPNGPYFAANGLGILSGPSVYGTLDCRVNNIGTTPTVTPPKKGKGK
jgi:hypothetical protein